MEKQPLLLVTLAVTLALAGCGKDTKLVLTVMLKGEAASSVKFDVLPYDIEAIQDSLLSANAPPEPPDRQELLALRGAYDQITLEYSDHLEEYRNSEAEVKKYKNFTSNAYKAAYKRFEDAKAKNAELNEKREQARSAYIGVKKQCDQQLEAWEEQAYAGKAEVIARIREKRGITEDYLIKTDKEGSGRIVVPGGKWWLKGKERHPEKRYTWLVWNVPIEATGGVLDVALSEDDAREWME
jgi:hypothetical protein